MTDQKDRPGSDDDMGLTAEDMELTFEEGAQEIADGSHRVFTLGSSIG